MKLQVELYTIYIRIETMKRFQKTNVNFAFKNVHLLRYVEAVFLSCVNVTGTRRSRPRNSALNSIVSHRRPVISGAHLVPSCPAADHLLNLLLETFISKAVDKRVDTDVHNNESVECLVHGAVDEVVVQAKIVEDVVDLGRRPTDDEADSHQKQRLGDVLVGFGEHVPSVLVVIPDPGFRSVVKLRDDLAVREDDDPDRNDKILDEDEDTPDGLDRHIGPGDITRPVDLVRQDEVMKLGHPAAYPSRCHDQLQTPCGEHIPVFDRLARCEVPLCRDGDQVVRGRDEHAVLDPLRPPEIAVE